MRRLHPAKIDTPEYYEKIWAVEYNTRPFYDAVRMRALAARVEADDRVVDLGAGCFGAAQYIAEEMNIDCDLYAVDYSHTAKQIVVNRLKERPRFTYVLSPAENTPLRDAFFDCVMSGELIEHYEDPRQLVKEMARLCKPFGWMTLSTVDTNCENAKKHGPYPEHVFEFEPSDLIGFFAPYGEVSYRLVGDYHFVECNRNALHLDAINARSLG